MPVTVDIMLPGTDVKTIEMVFSMRMVKSQSLFEQMKVRVVRVMSPTEFQAVTPDAKIKTHFVVIDAVGVCERDKSDSRPLEQKPSVPIEKLLEGVALGVREPEALTSLAARLIRLEKQLEPSARPDVKRLAAGKSLSHLAK